MGWNTTVVVYNDALGAIRSDLEFGRKLAEAIGEISLARHQGRDHVDVSAGNHCNAAMVVESHHADSTVVVTVGGNLGICQATSYGWDHHELAGQKRLLSAWADKLGYRLHKKPK